MLITPVQYWQPQHHGLQFAICLSFRYDLNSTKALTIQQQFTLKTQQSQRTLILSRQHKSMPVDINKNAKIHQTATCLSRAPFRRLQSLFRRKVPQKYCMLGWSKRHRKIIVVCRKIIALRFVLYFLARDFVHIQPREKSMVLRRRFTSNPL